MAHTLDPTGDPLSADEIAARLRAAYPFVIATAAGEIAVGYAPDEPHVVLAVGSDRTLAASFRQVFTPTHADDAHAVLARCCEVLGYRRREP